MDVGCLVGENTYEGSLKRWVRPMVKESIAVYSSRRQVKFPFWQSCCSFALVGSKRWELV